jgi:hypothetical protein
MKKYKNKDAEIVNFLLALGDGKLENYYLQETRQNKYLIGYRYDDTEKGWYLNLEEDEETHQEIVDFLLEVEALIISNS